MLALAKEQPLSGLSLCARCFAETHKANMKHTHTIHDLSVWYLYSYEYARRGFGHTTRHDTTRRDAHTHKRYDAI